MTTISDFPKFGELPVELRLRVWRAALSYVPDERGRRIEIRFRRKVVYNPAYTLIETENDLRNGLTESRGTEFVAEFSFDFSVKPKILMSCTERYLPLTNREVFYEFFPNMLGLVDESGMQCGVTVRFNAEFDTIFMDLESLRSLYDYTRPAQRVPAAATEGGFGPSEIARKRNLTGFDLIRRLATPLPATPTIDGIEYLRHHIFTGLTHPIEEYFEDWLVPPNVQLSLGLTGSSRSIKELLNPSIYSSMELFRSLKSFLEDCEGLTPEWLGPSDIGRAGGRILQALADDLEARMINEGITFFSITSAL